MARNSVEKDEAAGTTERPLQERAMEAVRSAPETARQTASMVAEKAPDALSASQDAIRASQQAIDQASRRLQATPPQELTAWAAFGVGTWIGLLLGRAPRVLVLAAGLPALVLAGALIARRDTPEDDLG